ncbi:MAG: ABC transporter permease [Planctomycetota bacterium]
MPETPRKGSSLWNDAWRRLRKNWFAMGGLVVMTVVTLISVFAWLLVPMPPDYGQPWLRSARPPGFEHPAVLAEIRFDVGEAPVIPERIPDRIADYLGTDGTIRYRVLEVAEREYRIRVRRKRVERIQKKEGAVSVKSLEVKGASAVARLIDADAKPYGPELRDIALTRRRPLPDALKEFEKSKVLLLRVREPRTEEPEEIEVVIGGGKVTGITRGGEAQEKLRTQGRFVLAVEKDGAPQSFRHLMGTDDVGRDVWSRVVYGGQISLMVGAVATLVSVLIGVIYGAVSGYLARAVMSQWHILVSLLAIGMFAVGLAANAILGTEWPFLVLLLTALLLFLGTLFGGNRLADRLPGKRSVTTYGEYMMRIVDILYALPFMFLVILLMISYGRDLLTLFIALGAVQWLMMARIVRGQVLSLNEKEFIEAARMCGASHASIVFRHLIPNTLGIVIVYATLTVPAVILQESFLSFIGLTVEFQGRTLDSWGSLVDQGRQALTASGGKWWILLFPSLAMAITLFSLNFLGDGLRDALDPKMKGKS